MIDYTKVRGALRSRLLTVEGVTDANVAWQNKPYTPTAGTLYVRETLLHAEEKLIASGQVGGSGLYQLDVFVPVGASVEEQSKLQKRIGDAFEPPQAISLGGVTVEIDRAAPLNSEKSDAGWYIFPVSIRWRSYTSTRNR